MVSMEEIFLSYVITKSGETIFHVLKGKGFLLEQGKDV
ncbi:hypothetical protein ES703_78929 [subsurface metagenome]